MDRDGVLNFNEIKDMIDILIFVSRESSNSNNFKSITAESVISELYQRVSKGATSIDTTEVCAFLTVNLNEIFNFSSIKIFFFRLNK